MYSPENTTYFPKACCNPAWNSLRQPGARGVGFDAAHPSSGFKTGLSHPTLATITFSLNGVSSTLAYESRRTVLLRLMLYARPRRGSASLCVVKPL